ncbi:MAG: hypothetical protein CMK00_01150 [Planctomycetes bacterium]|nr:hypothetical protein [Planctomycetota bacterium]
MERIQYYFMNQRHIIRPLTLLGITLLAFGPAGCNTKSSVNGGLSVPGSQVDNPDGSGSFIADPNNQGLGTKLRLAFDSFSVPPMFWGRLVNIYDGNGVLQHERFVIGEDIRSDSVDFLVEDNAVTGQTTLTILHTAGSAGYLDAFGRLEINLIPVYDQDLSGTDIYSVCPRNAALVLRFDDLLDENTIDGNNIKVFQGNPPIVPFEARIYGDRNHGDIADRNGDGVPEFYTTRVIIDTTVSEIESFESDPPLPVNSVGFEASVTTAQANIAIRIPSEVNPVQGQFTRLLNPTGHGVTLDSNGTVDEGSDEVLRALRSGGPYILTGDLNNGFMEDLLLPAVVGTQPVSITTIADDPNSLDDLDFIVDLTFAHPSCAQTPTVGDVIRQPGIFAEVTVNASPHIGGVVTFLRLRLLLGTGDEFRDNGVGPGQFLSTFDSAVDAGSEPCFVSISPTPGVFPNEQVSTAAQLSIRFSEPMDPTSLTAFDTMMVTRTNTDIGVEDYVVGQVMSSSDLKEFTFIPVLPLSHTLGGEEDYFITLASGQYGPTDLAGNELTDALTQSTFTMDRVAASESNGGRVLRFSSDDEAEPIGDPDAGEDPKTELRGQFLYDLTREVIKPRPVTRFAGTADRTQPVPGMMTPFPSGLQTPLSPLGSKLMTVWRYVDVNFGLLDETYFNVDVEGLNWAPVGGQAVADYYSEFKINLSHSGRLPDEVIDPSTLFPMYPKSGLKKTYTVNLLDPDNDPQVTVHPKHLGYTVNPANMFMTPTGTMMMPFPLNRTVAISDYRYYTWRDTTVTGVGGVDSAGAEMGIYLQVMGLPGAPGLPYGPGQVPTIGLPLLMEYNCYPDDLAVGMNSFDISLAVNSSMKPNFRAFSTGGMDTSTTPQYVDPDLETQANGGYNPTSNPPGQATPGLDNTFYVGQMDLVVRVSQVHTIWFEAAGLTSPTYLEPVLEPLAQDQPLGTEVVLAFRGATNITTAIPKENATYLDAYGNIPTGVVFMDDDTWKPSISDIDGAAWYQTRITFISNTETYLTPELSALAVAYYE